MPNLGKISDFTGLFIADTPLIDTRSPIEFEQGAFPHTQNLMLMNDEERARVGICYKNQGQQAAIILGHKLVQGNVKQKRIQAWHKFIQKHPNGALYCFRGGIRSQISQQWIYDKFGINYPRIDGGYKALRRFLIDETTRIMSEISVLVIGGQTGCGKTLLLNKINNKIDLEGLANHRGSAFGGTITPQPTQINFENCLAIELIKHPIKTQLIFEDEATNVGTLHIPLCVQEKTAQADLILLQADIKERVKISMDTYVVNMHRDFIRQDGKNGFANFANYWLISLKKIQKRLGLERYNNLLKMLKIALTQCQERNNYAGFEQIVQSLLVDYYDPMYDYQIQKKMDKVVFKGNESEVLAYLNAKKTNE